jgi:hypothetical protein
VSDSKFRGLLTLLSFRCFKPVRRVKTFN